MVSYQKDLKILKFLYVCLLCNLTLLNESLVPNKLKRHLEKNLPEQKDKPSEYFERLAVERKLQSEKRLNFTKLPEKELFASFEIAQLLAKRKKAHTEAESIIAPALAIIIETMLGSKSAAKVRKFPMSNAAISRRITDISSDLQDQIEDLFKTTEERLWVLQVDESTDISGQAQCLAFIRFIKDGKLVNEFLFCRTLKGTTKGSGIYKMVNENILRFNFNCGYCVGIFTDRCPSIQGKNKGFVTLALQQNSNIVFVHCMIHRESLVSKSLPKDVHSIMIQVFQVMNFIKSRPLKSRLFAQLSEEMDSDNTWLL